MPAGVLLGTVILPLLSSVGVALLGDLGSAGVTTVTLTVLVVAVAVPILSLSSTELVLVPVVIVKVSSSALIGVAGTTTVAAALEQLLGFSFSQMRYTIV